MFSVKSWYKDEFCSRLKGLISKHVMSSLIRTELSTGDTMTKLTIQYWAQCSVVLSDSAGTVVSGVATLRVFPAHIYHSVFFPHGATASSEPGHPYYRGFTITLRHITFGRIPLDGWSARRRDLYLITHNNHMTPAVFDPAISANEQPQNHTLDRAATSVSVLLLNLIPW